MMQIFCVFSIFLVPTLASKETVSHGGLVLKDKSIMSLIKRLKTLDLDFLDESQSKKTGACESRIEGGSIIRATESINGGAVFLDSVKNLSSNAECYSLCCQNKSCDVAVYQSKNERYCYLFRCEDKCKFKKHANYTTNRINRPSEGTQSSEAALQNLNQDSNPDQEDDYQQQQQQQQQTAEVKAPTLVYPEESTEKDKAVFITPHTVGLGGYCTADNNCEDPNASCRSGTCDCSDGYYNKNGLCRKSCPQKEFECYKLGTLSRGPECIPENQVCDSYLQCADGSDEFNCEATEFPSGSGLSKPSKTHIQKPAAKPVSKPEHKQTVPHESKEVITVKTTHPTVVVTKAPAVTSKPNPVWNGKNNDNSKEAQSPSKDTTRAPSVSKSNDSVFMSREKVIIASTTSNAEGPIIALSLGLAFTLILLVLVGCRMRTMRTRLRKGRPLNQNEADYLINGMYL